MANVLDTWSENWKKRGFKIGDKEIQRRDLWINMCVWTWGEGGAWRAEIRRRRKEEREKTSVPHVNTHQTVASSEEHITKK